MRITVPFVCLLCFAACNGGGDQLLNEINGDPTSNPNGVDPISSDPNSADPNAITCPDLGTWDPNSVAFEAQVLVLVNQARAKGADCHSEGTFAATTPLTNDAALVCLARSYSKEMHDQNFFSHTDPNGKSPFDRMDAAGIKWSSAGENIAAGYATPQDVVTGWLGSDGHCANVMGHYTLTGIGFYQQLWTQDFITP